MKNGFLRVFPSLLQQSMRSQSAILDKSVAVSISIMIDPVQRLFDVRPDAGDQFSVSSALEIRRSQQNEEWRRIDAAIITTERNFPHPRHFTLPRFMQYLPWFSVLAGITRGCLGRCQVRENSPSDLWTGP